MNLKKGNIKIYLALFLVCLVFFLFLGRSFQLQILQHRELTRMGQALSKRDIDVDPVRGEILDINGTRLAASVKVYDLWVTQSDLALDKMEEASDLLRFQEHLKTLEEILGVTPDEFMRKANGPDSSFLVAGNVEKGKIDLLREKWPPWLVSADSYRRVYPSGSIAPNIIGTTDGAGNGLAGVEQSLNSTLRGISGKVLMETDLWGNQLALREARLYAPINGSNVQLTLSLPKQRIVEEWVKKAYDELKPEGHVTAILMKTKTGAIEAVASYPHYDLNNPRVLPATEENAELTPSEYSEKLFESWKSPANSFVYEPGSVSKVLTTAIGLETGSFNVNTYFNDRDGSVEYDDGTILYCHVFPRAHGEQTLEEALVNSCNPAFILMRRYIGIETFYNYIESFGLTYRVGMPIGEESFPWFLPRVGLRQIEADTMSYGHGFSVTPIQMLTAVNAVVNDGKLMAPRIVERYLTDEGEVLEENPPKLMRQVISSETSAIMRSLMRSVVDDVPAENAYEVESIGMGAKTGTTNLLEMDVNGKPKNITSYFLTAPIDDPEYSLLLVADRPTERNFSFILIDYTSGIMLDVLHQDGYREANSESELIEVPNLIGLSDEGAQLQLSDAGLEGILTNYHEKGELKTVLDQFPKAGARVGYGAKIILDFGDHSPEPPPLPADEEPQEEGDD